MAMVTKVLVPLNLVELSHGFTWGAMNAKDELFVYLQP